jgi:polysaccharide export outer membrane protein
MMWRPGRLGVLRGATLAIWVAWVPLWAQSAAPGAGAAQPVKVEAPSSAQPLANAAPLPVDHRAYQIGPQDYLRIEVWQNQELTRAVVVRPDGRFSMPLIGEVQAEGLTPERLEAQLEQALNEYVINPDVTVSVLQVNSKSYRVSGYVNRPGIYPLVTPVRVYEAIVDAGGFRDYANRKDVLIIRGNQRIKFNAEDYRKGKNLDKNILVENGDIIEVHD